MTEHKPKPHITVPHVMDDIPARFHHAESAGVAPGSGGLNLAKTAGASLDGGFPNSFDRLSVLLFRQLKASFKAEPLPVPPVEVPVPVLIGQVYESAPAGLRARMIELLLQPLGVLSLIGIANGVFAKIRFQGGWPRVHVHLEQANAIRASDVVALAERAQQFGGGVIEGALARLISASPVLAGSAAAAMLLTVLMQRARKSARR